MNKWSRKIKDIKDTLEFGRILSPYTWSNIIKIPKGDRFQVNMTTFVRCIANPQNPIGNVFILQGGVRHMNTDSYYTRMSCSLLSKSLRIFVFEKLFPVVNFEFGHDVADCLTFIKREFHDPICVIGYSVGGLLLYTYLSMGYDQADLYLPVCCPLDLDYFREAVNNHLLFRYIIIRACHCYKVSDFDNLVTISGTSPEQNKLFESTFIQRLNSHSDKWSAKTIYILSEDDPLTKIEDVNLLDNKPLTYLIKGGWHCCLDTIYLSSRLINNYMNERSLGNNPTPSKIIIT